MSSHISGIGIGILIENNVALVLGLFLVTLRAHSAREINGRWRWDFIWILMTIILHLANSFLIDYAVHVGLGRKLTSISFTQLPKIIHWGYIVVFMSLPAAVMAKFSIISRLLQLQGPRAKKRRLALFVLAVLLALITFVAIFLALFQCKPVNELWNIFEDGECPYTNQAFDFLTFQGAFTAFTDLVLALWPISIVWNLKMSTRTKVSFCILMAISILAIVAAIQRCILTVKARSSLDPLPQYAKVIIWGSVEQWLVVILGSIPPLRPLFLRIFSKNHASNELGLVKLESNQNERSNRKNPGVSAYDMTELGEEVE